MSSWDPDLYLRFQQERTQPSRDLVHRIQLSKVNTAIDVGCGAGNSTAVIQDRWPDSILTGLDSSETMIERARSEYPALNFICADASSWQPDETYDLVFSNAMIQWITDQERLLRNFISWLNPGGALAVQVPANHGSPFEQALNNCRQSDTWKRFFQSSETYCYFETDCYYKILAPVSTKIEIWQTTYGHILDSPAAAIDWYRSTGLRPVLDALPDESTRDAFLKDLLVTVTQRFPPLADGKILFPFNRIFFIAYK